MGDRGLSNPSPPPSFFEEPEAKVKKEDVKAEIKKENIKKEKVYSDYYQDKDGEVQYEKSTLASEFFSQQATKRQEKIYRCDVCDSEMNSEEIYLTHLKGKKHQRKVAAASFVAPSGAKAIKRPDVNVQHIKTTGTPMRVVTRSSNARSLMQSEIDKHRSSAIIGLSYVTEIRMANNETDPVYYCHLCPAECQSTTLISHVIGFKHKASYLRLADPKTYSKIESSTAKKSESGVRLEEYAVNLEREDGRGQIMVEIQVTPEDENKVKPEDEDVEVLSGKRQPQFPPSVERRLWDHARCLTNNKRLEVANAIVQQLAFKQGVPIDYEAKFYSIIQEREKKLNELIIQIRLNNGDMRKVLSQKAKEGDYIGMLDCLYKMQVSSMGQIGRSVVAPLMSKQGIVCPVKKERETNSNV